MLQQYANTNYEVEQIKEKIIELRDRMTTITSTQFDAVPGGHSNGDKIGGLVAKIDELERTYQDKLLTLVTNQMTLESLIEQLNDKERLLIRKRYEECKTWETVCVEMNYSWRQMHRLHAYTLTKLDLLDKDGTQWHSMAH